MVNLKSMREIGLMRRAGLAVWQAHQIAARMVRPGVTTAAIDRAIAEHFEQLGAQPLFKNYPNTTRNKPPFPAVCCMSVNEAVVHGIPTDKPLLEGDVLSLDTGCRINGWCGDAAYTYPVGRIAPDVAAAARGDRRGAEPGDRADELQELLERHRPRNGRLHSRSRVLDGRVLRGSRHRPRHARGPAGSELSEPVAAGSGDFRIEPGLVIAVEPMVNMGTKRVKMLSDHWTQVTADGKPSAHFEHTVAVTHDGPLLLTVAPTPAEREKLAV